jgi:putative zinc finger/helix-turn-helix YgiT family protein
MKRCPECGGKVEKALVADTVEVGRHEFTARVPAFKCRGCGEVYFDGPALEKLELRAAVELAKAGESSPEVMRFMRKALGMKAAELAALLDLTPETVSRWETGKQPLEHRAMAVLGSLVIERSEGRTAVLDTLKALQKPRKLGRVVKLSLAGVGAH